MDDGDFKISMDDIKDMVSELFGEKVNKVDTDEARKILKEEMLGFFENAPEETPQHATGVLSDEEERLLKEFEAKQDTLSGTYEILSALSAGTKPGPDLKKDDIITPAPAVEKTIDQFGLPQVDGELKLKPAAPPVTEHERMRRREETLKKLEESKKQSAEYQASLAKRAVLETSAAITTHAEKLELLKMFELSQEVFAKLLSKLIKRRAVETMMARTLEKAAKVHAEVLKKSNVNQAGKTREDGSLEIPRVMANINAMMTGEEKRTEKFFMALRGLFEERLIAAEIATSIEVKDDIISATIMQTDTVFGRNYSRRLKDIFMEHAVPNTTMKSGE